MLTSVHRYFSLFGLQPHRTETFKLSTVLLFIESLHDVVGLYLNPPKNMLALCKDGKSQCRALGLKQPTLLMVLNYVEGVTHDDVGHGTTTWFAAMNVRDNSVFTSCKPRHRHHEFLEFLSRFDKLIPTDLDLRRLVKNYSSHKHPKVKAWLAVRTR